MLPSDQLWHLGLLILTLIMMLMNIIIIIIGEKYDDDEAGDNVNYETNFIALKPSLITCII